MAPKELACEEEEGGWRLELREQFTTLDEEGSGFIELEELREALEMAGFKVPGWRIRDIMDKYSGEAPRPPGPRKVSYSDFEAICAQLRAKEVSQTFKAVVSKRDNLRSHGGSSEASAEGTQHSVRVEEELAFTDWINSALGEDPTLAHLLPIQEHGLYEAVQDGVLLCKVVNHSCPSTVDERAIVLRPSSVYQRHENLTLALTSAQSIGCSLVNIGAIDLIKGTPHLVLGLLWQIIRVGLLSHISLDQCPGLAALLPKGDHPDTLVKMAPEAILLRWVNHHLEQAGVTTRITNLTSDIRDSEVYSHLLHQIAPPDAGVTKQALAARDLGERAELMLQEAELLGCRAFVSPSDVVEGRYKLNLAFVANLFNKHPGLETPDSAHEVTFSSLEETREEKTYRNWMNSLGVSPHVNWMYEDLSDGLIILQLYDIIKPGVVAWSRVHRKFNRMRKFMEKLENCNYAVDLGRDRMKFSLVGIAGQDICEGNETLSLALVWQLMRSYTLGMLENMPQLSGGKGGRGQEGEIIKWVNRRLQGAGKATSIKSFQDPCISSGLVLVDLIDAIKPGAIDYSLVAGDAREEARDAREEAMANAKYGISMARRLGARVYALPEDVVEVKPKMVMTVFAVLMAKDTQDAKTLETRVQDINLDSKTLDSNPDPKTSETKTLDITDI